jgi:hypothetical protein
VEHFVVSATPLPVNINKEEVLKKLQDGIPRQAFSPRWFEDLPKLKQKTYTLLQCRNSNKNCEEAWDKIFSMFPSSASDFRYLEKNYSNALNLLCNSFYCNDIQVKYELIFVAFGD